MRSPVLKDKLAHRLRLLEVYHFEREALTVKVVLKLMRDGKTINSYENGDNYEHFQRNQENRQEPYSFARWQYLQNSER